jgi:hypothetical protein
MLKDEWKQCLVLLFFSIMLKDVLTIASLLFIALGFVLLFFGLKTGKIIRNALALGIFSSYWFKYGKIIDPEVGLNFLTSIVMLKILEKETIRDRYMIFYGLILLIASGSLFERTLTYFLFFSLSFFFLINDFYSFLGRKWRLKDFWVSFFWVGPLTLLLFFFVPRLMNPIPFQQNETKTGEIGYTSNVDISQIDSLEPNTTPVFHATASEQLKQSELYWRGNILASNDGWNWQDNPLFRAQSKQLLGMPQIENGISQSIRLFNRSNYFFSLDYARIISYGKDIFDIYDTTRSLAQGQGEWVQRYEVVSKVSDELYGETPGRKFLNVPISSQLKKEIKKKFQGQNLSELTQSIKDHFIKEEFIYSLSPGPSLTLMDFLERKIGLCSHYASSTALILRIHGIPTRLVSGYMGGTFNPYSGFYLISQNDAHVWLEAFSDGKWQRVDPTEWVAIERVLLGGADYVASTQKGIFKKNSSFKMPAFVGELQQRFDQLNFHFYQWIENTDYHTQENWLSRFNFRREWLYSLVPLIMVIFMLIYTLYLTLNKKQDPESVHQELWRLFYKRMRKRGVLISKVNLNSSLELVKKQENPEVLGLWNELILVSFQGKKASIKDLKKRIRSL